MVLADSNRVPRVPLYSGVRQCWVRVYTFKGLLPSMARLSRPVLLYTDLMREQLHTPTTNPTTPMCKRHSACNHIGLGCSPFARRYLGNRSFFLFLRVLRCFSSPRSLLRSYEFTPGSPALSAGGVSPFGNLRVNAYLTTRRSLSQSITSFFASQRQGIHRMPFIA